MHYGFSVQKFEVDVWNTIGKLTDCFELHKPKGFQNDKTHKVSGFKTRGFMVATEYVRSSSNSCGVKNKQKIERLQRRASRIVLKNSRELTSDAIIERLGCRYSIDEMNISKN